MEPNDKPKMLTLLLAFSVATFVLMVVAIFYIVKMCRNLMNAQPRVQPPNRPHQFRDSGREEGVSLNHSVFTHNRRRPQQNDERFCRTGQARGPNPDAVAAPVAAPASNAITP
ncbi:uncharacterized protein LOC144655615 [Oculina patagonica]